jgi:hypothetical protein
MSDLSEFYLNSKSSIVELDLLTISHPDFTQVFRIVRNSLAGITVTLEDGITVQTFDYYPLVITPTGSSNDLDQTLKVTLGDLGTLIPQELDAVSEAGTFRIKPQMIYRQYRSDRLTGPPIEGPSIFEIENIAFNDDGATFQASAPRVNLTGTGERYNLDRFPMLRNA